MAENEMQNNNNLLKDLNLSNDNNKEKDVKTADSNPGSDPVTRKIFIDHVICNETKFSDLEVRDHVYTVVAAVSLSNYNNLIILNLIFMDKILKAGRFDHLIANLKYLI